MNNIKNNLKNQKVKIILLISLISLLLFSFGCENSSDSIEIDDSKVETITEIDNQNEIISGDENSTEDNTEVDLYNPGVREIIERARGIKNWHYRSEGDEVTICGSNIKIVRDKNILLLNTESKDAELFECGNGCVRSEQNIKYSDAYTKTTLDYLNEESFLDAVVAEHTKSINGRRVIPVEAEENNIKKIYWFDAWKKGGMLLEIEYKDVKSGEIFKRTVFETFEPNPNNIREADCRV